MNTPTLDARSKTIFDRLIELDPKEREQALSLACSNDATLADRVRSLLRADADSQFINRIIDRAGATAGITDPIEASQVIIDRYRLVRRIATGGMGEVFEGQQLEPIERPVAIKLIKPGLGSTEIVQRFETERQVLSLMKHASIATVFDAGTSADFLCRGPSACRPPR